MEDDFSADSLMRCLEEACAALGQDAPVDADGKLCVLGSVDSTNSELSRRLSECGPLLDGGGMRTEEGRRMHGCVVAAAHQTAGRGRSGRAFYSPPKSGVYFSFVHVPEGGLSQPALVTAACAVGVCRAIESCYGTDCGIKWVNDIYVGGRKVCGILVEGFVPPSSGRVEAAIVGIGINISLNPSLADASFELSRAGGIIQSADASSVSRSMLVASCLAHIRRILDAGGGFMDEYRARSVLVGKTVTVSPLAGGSLVSGGGRYEAVVRGVTDDAALLVSLPDGTTRALRSGEVTLH